MNCVPICIVGCGGYARKVLDDVRGDGMLRAEFFFASRDAAKARAYCAEYDGAGHFGSYEDAARDPRVAALYFLTPHDLHLANAKLAARHGKHILMEKPIARTMREGRAIIDAARAAGVTLMVAENFHFAPAVTMAKRMIEDGAVGETRFVEARSEGFDAADEWRQSLERTGGGRFIDGGIHFVDILRTLAGVPDRVYARLHAPRVFPDLEGEDGVTLTASYPSGATGLVHYAGGAPIRDRESEVRVVGTKGRIRFDVFGEEIVLDTSGGARVIPVERAYRGVRGMLREFVDAVISDREPALSAQDALTDLAIVLAAYESARTGAAVALESLP